MISQETNQLFKDYLQRFTELFQDEYDMQKGNALKTEINKLNKNEVIECWLAVFKAQGPIEKVSDKKYEIYDVNNFLDNNSDTSGDYIHLVELTDTEDAASVFMKFYFVFYSLINGIRSSEYQIIKGN